MLQSTLGGRSFGRCCVCYAGLLRAPLSVHQGNGGGPATMASVPIDSHIPVWALRTCLWQLFALLHSKTPRQPDPGVATSGCQLSAADFFALSCFQCSQGQSPGELKTLVANEPLRTRHGLHPLTHFSTTEHSSLLTESNVSDSGSGPRIHVAPDTVL